MLAPHRKHREGDGTASAAGYRLHHPLVWGSPDLSDRDDAGRLRPAPPRDAAATESRARGRLAALAACGYRPAAEAARCRATRRHSCLRGIRCLTLILDAHSKPSPQSRSRAGPTKARAMRVVIAIFGILAGLAAIEHGIGEINQGSTRPARLLIQSWPIHKLSPFLPENRR
jgi:hypothetical protein